MGHSAQAVAVPDAESIRLLHYHLMEKYDRCQRIHLTGKSGQYHRPLAAYT